MKLGIDPAKRRQQVFEKLVARPIRLPHRGLAPNIRPGRDHLLHRCDSALPRPRIMLGIAVGRLHLAAVKQKYDEEHPAKATQAVHFHFKKPSKNSPIVLQLDVIASWPRESVRNAECKPYNLRISQGHYLREF